MEKERGKKIKEEWRRKRRKDKGGMEKGKEGKRERRNEERERENTIISISHCGSIMTTLARRVEIV